MNSYGQKLSLYQRFRRAMVQAACHVRSQATPCGIYGEQSSIEVGFAPRTSVFHSQYRSTIAPLTSHPHPKTLAIISVVKQHTHTHISFHILLLAHTVCGVSVSYTSDIFTLIMKAKNRIYWPNERLVIDKLRKLHNERLRNRYSSSGTVKVIKSSTRWVGHTDSS